MTFAENNKIDKHMAGLLKKTWEKTQITHIRNEKGAITVDAADTKIIRGFYEQIYTIELDNSKKRQICPKIVSVIWEITGLSGSLTWISLTYGEEDAKRMETE